MKYSLKTYTRRFGNKIKPVIGNFIFGLNKILGPVLAVFSALTLFIKKLFTPIGMFVLRVVDWVHYQIASRPHVYLMKRFGWYRWWHANGKKQLVLQRVSTAFMALIIMLNVAVFQIASAAPDLTDFWNFSTPSQFTFDDGVEASGTSAQLKAQNYVTDDQTSALYHFDEPSGATASDSTINNNTAAVSNATFGAGNLNNALTFNGTTSKVTAPDNAANSLSQRNTIEAWTKFNSSFSAGSHTQRQNIVDKGDYSLYFDNTNGKLSYELSDNNPGDWSQNGGGWIDGSSDSWESETYSAVESSAVYNGELYVSTGKGFYSSSYGTGKEVWKWNGTSWQKIGGNGLNGSNWAYSYDMHVHSLVVYDNKLIAGLSDNSGGFDVWAYNGSLWTDITSIGFSAYGCELGVVNNVLYAGGYRSNSAGDIWQYSGSGTSWTQIAGDSLKGGWSSTEYSSIAFMGSYQSQLVAGTGNFRGIGDYAENFDGDVWLYNGTTWSKIGGDGVSGSWTGAAGYYGVWSLVESGTDLMAGLAGVDGDAEVWKYNGTTWTQIGGDGEGGSWSGAYYAVGAMAYYHNELYAGLFSSTTGNVEVWKYDGSTWSQVGGDGLNSSWNTPISNVSLGIWSFSITRVSHFH